MESAGKIRHQSTTTYIYKTDHPVDYSTSYQTWSSDLAQTPKYL